MSDLDDPSSSDFERAFARLASLTNYEKQPPQRSYRFDLASMEELCARLGNPQLSLGQVAQIAGSKGKGSATHMLAGMGVALGKQVAAYTSPHVVDVLERVLWNGQPVSQAEFAPSLQRATDALREGQTWFEVFTAAALDHFSQRRPDWTVLEVGLGGRLDSTTVVPKHVSAITTIELEHTHVLGNDEVSIAREKAGILRPGVPCVTMCTGEPLAVIVKRCKTMGVPLRVFGRDFGYELLQHSERGLELELWRQGDCTRRIWLPVHGRVLARAFVLARELLQLLDPEGERRLFGGPAPSAAELEALDFGWAARALPPARFQVFDRQRPIVIDGAHTDVSLTLLAEDLEAAFPGRRFRLIFGVASGKRWQGGLGRLLHRVDSVHAAPLVGKTSEACETVAEFCDAAGVECQVSASISEAFREALAAGDDPLLVTGSLYAAGEALQVLRSER
jgi:dihydrofolate synthase/folylpolyglutamate synthase